MSMKMKSILLLFLAVLTANVSLAQIDYSTDPRFLKYGATAEERQENYANYSFFTESMKMKSWDDAERRLEELLVKAPGATENLYINGRRLYITQMRSAATPEAKDAYVEKLVRLQEIRNEHFAAVASRGTKEIWKTRFLDFLQYKPNDVDRIVEYGSAAIAAAGNDVDPDMATAYFNALSNFFMMDQLAPDVYLNEYDVIANSLSNGSNPESQGRLEDCETIFVQSGAANCENLEKIYKPKYDEDPSDVALIRKVMSYMVTSDCEGDFRVELSEKLFEIEPNADAAYTLGLTFDRAGDPEKAREYILKAIELEEDPMNKANFQVRMAATSLAEGNAMESIEFARAASQNDPNNGLAFLLLAQAYGAVSDNTGCSGLQKKASYWIIVDVLNKAKSLLADDQEQVSRINTLVSNYSQHFPTTEELFFDESMKAGSRYTVNCGVISGVTTLRAAK